MSTREKIIALLDGVPEYKMGYILAYVQGLTADEDAETHSASRCMSVTRMTPKRMWNLRWRNVNGNGGLLSREPWNILPVLYLFLYVHKNSGGSRGGP